MNTTRTIQSTGKKFTKPGRPSTHGMQPPWTLLRAMFALAGYDASRSEQNKHDVAIDDAVENIRSRFPVMPISRTEVKRILTYHRAKHLTEVLVFKEEAMTGEELEAHLHRQISMAEHFPHLVKVSASLPTSMKVWRAYYAPPPNYPRINAVSR